MRARPRLACVLGWAVTACSSGGGSTTEPQYASTLDGLRYAARSRVVSTPAAQGGVSVLRTTVTVQNTGAEPAVVQPDACPVVMRLYRDPSRSGNAVWDQEPGLSCSGGLLRRALRQGESVTFETMETAPALLSGGVPAGVYYVAVTVRLNDARVVLPAGDATIPAS